MPNYSLYSDVELLAICAWKEGRGQISKFGLVSILAIMHAITNRVGHIGFAKTIREVILGHNQFTSMSVPSDPEYELLPNDQDPIYQGCLDEATGILAGTDPDETNGSVWYANLAHINPGGWFDRNIVNHPEIHPVTAKIGDHTFFS